MSLTRLINVNTAMPPPPPTLCKMSTALMYGILLSFVTTMSSIAIPTEIGWYAPHDAAINNGLLLFATCLFHATAPLAGILSDRAASRRPLIIIGMSVLTAGIVGISLSVSMPTRNALSFILFCISYLGYQVGVTALGVSFAGLLADFGKVLPEKVGSLSGIKSLFDIFGTSLGFVVQGVVMPVKFNDHRFYYILLAMTLIGNIGLLCVPAKIFVMSKRSVDGDDLTTAAIAIITDTDTDTDTTTTTTTTTTATTATIATTATTVFQEWSSANYSGWRYVVLSRFLFFAGLGVFSALMLYFLEDCTDAGIHAPTMYSYIALISLAASLIAVWPSGKLTDRFGTATVASVGAVGMSIFMACVVQFSTITMIMIVVPLYGCAQMWYNVGDTGLVIQSLSNDKTKARDMGGWNAAGNFGVAIGSALSSSFISRFHIGPSGNGGGGSLTPSSSSSSSSSGMLPPKRIAYQKIGYEMVFIAAALLMFSSAFFLRSAAKRLKFEEEQQQQQQIKI